MSPVGIFGILVCLAGYHFARAGASRPRFALFVLLLLEHILASIAAYQYAQDFGSDAQMYYYDTLQIYGTDSGLNTLFIINLVQGIKLTFGGSFLDHFLLFQAVGFWGILFILRAFDDIHEELGQPIFKPYYLILFLPGLHYWTSSIGKDGLMFFAVALCTWAAFRIQRRYVAFGAGVVLAAVVRPHIALLMLIALALTVLFARKTSLVMRTALTAVVLAGIASVAGLVEGLVYGLNLSSADSMSEVLESKSQVSEESGGDLSIMGASFPVKLFSLLFRPFFIDANGAFGYVASLENAALMLVFVILIFRFGTGMAIARSTMFARYAFFYFCLVILLLALFNYNVGLGLRQKMMAMPALLVFFAALLAVRTSQKRTVYAPGLAAYGGAPGAPPGYRSV